MDMPKSLVSALGDFEREVKKVKRSDMRHLGMDAVRDVFFGYSVLNGILNSAALNVNEQKYSAIIRELEFCVRSLDYVSHLIYCGKSSSYFRKPLSQSTNSHLMSTIKSQISFLQDGTLPKLAANLVASEAFFNSPVSYLQRLGKEVSSGLRDIVIDEINEERISPNYVNEYSIVYSSVLKMCAELGESELQKSRLKQKEIADAILKNA